MSPDLSRKYPAHFHNMQQALVVEYPDDAARQQLTNQLPYRLPGLLNGLLAAAEFSRLHWQF